MRPQFAFLDSGTGGIPYMLYLKQHFPDSRCVYLGDTANFPYGEKTADEVIACTKKAVSLILERFNPEAIVIACNTMSVTALAAVREAFPEVPFVGTVPAIKLAAAVTENKCIGLLATRQSVGNPYTEKLITDFASNCRVIKRGDPDLIEFIEKKLFSASPEERVAAVTPAVEYFRSQGADTIILGCTHFIHMAEDIQKVAGSSVRVIDSRDGVVRQAMRVIGGIAPKADESPVSGSGLLKAAEAVKENCAAVGTGGLLKAACALKGGFAEDMTFFITGDGDRAEYETLARNLKIPFGGKLV